jgi:protein phosphatase
LLEVHTHAIQADDLYLMCSDGLSDMLRDADIARLLRLPLSLELRAQALVDMANDRGGRDNITVLLVHAQGQRPAL